MPPRNNQSPLLSAFRQRLQSRLLSWFDRNRRDLPWRDNRDPYRIWVSEVMLQQTQVATVLRYFDPFIRAFPTIQALAAAPEQEVLRRWEGLGYYRRAYHLQQAARHLADEHGGRIPNDPEVFGELPGVGRYILGAVFSQAFDRRLPIVEANSRRVLCRLLGRKPAHDSNGIERWLWRNAEALLPARRVGDFNQALMELGALICTPAKPCCDNCPLKKCCVACRQGLQHEIPGHRPSPNEIVIQEVAVVVHRKNRVLLVQRPRTGRWPGMWEFPHDQVGAKETHESAAKRIVQRLVGLRIQLGPEIVALKHTLTRFRIILTCLEARYLAGKFRSRFYRKARWISRSEMHELPLSSPQRRLASVLL
jgi:A/G-specific adenine glycosylase